jgi:hypothetical protein
MRFAALASWSFVMAAVACNDGGPPPAAPTSVAAPITTVVIDAGAMAATSGVASSEPPATPATAASGDGGADYYSCSVDADCVAVDKASCCPNGWLEAVNKQSVDAYKASITCGKGRRICPMYRVMDKRVPLCGSSSHRCEMVQPEQIACGGTGPTVHACPSGAQCDGTGHCAGKP